MTDSLRACCVRCTGIPMMGYPALHARTLCRNRFVGRIRLHLCPGCGHESWHPDDLRQFDRALAWHLARAGASAPDALRAMRQATGLERSALAARLEVPESSVWRWERGEETPTAALLGLLCELVASETSSSAAFLLRIEPIPELRLASSRPHDGQAVVTLPVRRLSWPTDAG